VLPNTGTGVPDATIHGTSVWLVLTMPLLLVVTGHQGRRKLYR
jgi:hypothetical protein